MPSTRTLARAGAIALLAYASSAALADAPRYSFTTENFARFAGRTHAMLVHFPIALILLAAAIELFGALRDRRLPPDRRQTGISPVSLCCIVVGALGAAAAAAAGWLNAASDPPGSSVADALFWHRWLGVGVAGVAALMAIAALAIRSGASFPVLAAFRAALVVVAGLVGLTGHLGGSMVYGDGYLLAAFEDRSALPTVPGNPAAATVTAGNQSPTAPSSSSSDEAVKVAMASRVQAIFNASCIDCHGARKQKGDLRVDTLEWALASTSIVPGHPEQSDLVQRLRLPEDDDDFMPRDHDPLSGAQIAEIAAWVTSLTQGSKDVAATSTAGAPPATAPAVPKASPSLPVAAAIPQVVLTPEQKQAAQRAIDAIRGVSGYAAILSSDSGLVHVNFVMVGKACTDQTLALLHGLEPCLFELNLAGTAVTDAGLKGLAAFTHLERLNLSRTGITDGGLKDLASIRRLSSLNLYGTAVTDASVDVMSGMPALRRAFLWRTGMTPEGIARLSQARADISVDSGIIAPVVAASPPATDPAPATAATGTPAVPEAPSAAEPAKDATAALARKPGCCLKAESEGRECDHPCCVAARAQGKVCEKCLAGN